MPTYRNTDTDPRLFPRVSTPIPAGSDTPAVPGYIWPVPKYFELVSDEPKRPTPWVELADDLIANLETLTSLAQYAQIKVVNQSGADLSIVPNGDTDNPMKVITGSVEFITIGVSALGMKDINSLTFSGSGTSGNVSVYGLK
jgi:hypothetical protein